jgi:hypothetical protein
MQNELVPMQPGEIPNEPMQLQPAPDQDDGDIDRMLSLRTGGAPSKVLTSYDASTPQGQQMVMRHVQADTPKGIKDAWLNREFLLVAYTMRTVVAKRDANGEPLETPRTLIRSIMETSEGDLIPSASDYLAQDLRLIDQVHGGISSDKPVLVKIRKGGSADRLIDVEAATPRKVSQQPAAAGKAKSQ